ncbi:MAG: asparagine synthase (glutamine-hydrolyzing) [Agriterribacter sp.]
MCGIAGIISLNSKETDNGIIQRMTNAMSHRGPDAEGIFIDGEVALGHRRLSIIDLSSAANQPFSDQSGRYTIVFNGEIYNFREVRKMIADYPFRTGSDTEVLIAAYAKWGNNCFKYFKGMFAFAIWDKQLKKLCLVRDRMGVKPLYYFIDDKKILFASEVRALLSSGIIPKQISKNGLLEFFSYQSLNYPLTIIEGIQQLEAGTFLEIKNGDILKTRYWQLTSENTAPEYDNIDLVKETIKSLLTQSVKRRLVSDVPVAAFLSGGIDSSIVVGLMAEECKTKPDTFNISFGEKEFDESPYAEIIAKKFNTRHTKISLSPSIMLDELDNALASMDTPSGDGINTYVVSKAIKNAGIKVALSGVGGDELFAGYPIFNQYTRLNKNKFIWDNTLFFRRLISFLIRPSEFSSKKFRVMQILRLPDTGIENVYPILRQVIAPEVIKSLIKVPAQPTALQNELQQYASFLYKLPELSQVTAAELMGYTQHTLLKDTDQMSMAVALEVREPFFDSDLVEYVLGVPDKFKKPTYPKSLLVDAVKPLIPDEIVFRKKQGFVFPWQLWLKNELKNFCENHIKRLSQRDFIQEKMLIKYWNHFLKGDPEVRWADVWLFVVLEYWLEKNFD